MRNGGIGHGWYEDDPNAIQPTPEEIKLKEFFNTALKDKLIEVFGLISQQNKERRDAIEERKQQKNICE